MKKLIFYLPLLLSLLACEKLPNETLEGKETFGCLIDGKKFIVKSTDGKDRDDLVASYTIQDHDIRIWADIYHGWTTTGDKEEVFFWLHNYDLKVGKRQIENLVTQASYYKSEDNKGYWYENSSGFIEITHVDTISAEKSISGVFEFEGKSSNDTKKITKGRFDLILILH